MSRHGFEGRESPEGFNECVNYAVPLKLSNTVLMSASYFQLMVTSAVTRILRIGRVLKDSSILQILGIFFWECNMSPNSEQKVYSKTCALIPQCYTLREVTKSKSSIIRAEEYSTAVHREVY